MKVGSMWSLDLSGSKIAIMKVDYKLIIALVDRWRLETLTFNFSVYEANIALQDVEVLISLRVDQVAIIGSTTNVRIFFPINLDLLRWDVLNFL